MNNLTWYVAYTRVGSERKVAEALAEKAITAYLPAETRWVRRSHRKVRDSLPLFIGYVFVALDAEQPQFHKVRAIEGVSRFIGSLGEPRAIPAQLIAKLQSLEASGRFDYTREAAPTKRRTYRPGQPVRIVAGVLEGFDASVIRMFGRSNVQILYSLFGREAEATIDVAKIEAKLEAA